MTSDEIIETLELHAKLLELHGENAFKIKAFSNAAYKLNKLRYDFDGRSKEDIDKIEGIGKSISKFIYELIQHGSAQEHDELIEKTPPGVGDMLGIKGLGPKKVNAIWKELGIESVGELLYACNENRLAGLKGFGEKTQEAVKTSIEFKLQNTSKRHYAAVETLVNETIHALQIKHPHIQLSSVGDLRRKREIIDHIEILSDEDLTEELKGLEIQVGVPLKLHVCAKQEFTSELFRLTSTEKHLQQSGFNKLEKQHFSSEEAIYKALDMQYIEPELREGLHEVDLAKHHKIPVLIEDKDLKGILHNHTTYSDGINTLKEMADYCHKLGYEYLGICDHSKSAFYANGLNEDKVWEQRMEIAKLNHTYRGFKILSGIESDILNNGSLDYSEDVLKSFDFIVASVHSNLKMTEEKATQRLIKAIENPYTSILGHPTGRLLLARPGYPIDHKKVIDACAANKVSIELNAHPYRLDIDWRWIGYCMEKNVKVAINPDAHQLEGYHDMYYGVCVARKGMLTKEMCLNALSLPELLNEFKK
jgi:DNA polymerase (family 10)